MAGLVTVLVALVPSAPTGAGAARVTTPPNFFGVTVNGPADLPSINLRSEEAVMASYGVQTVRLAMNWNEIQPVAGRPPDFDTLDARIGSAAANGISVLGLVLGSPQWAALKPENPLSPPTEPSTYATFLTQLIDRYGPRGTFWAANPRLPRSPIRAWEIWNEPNLSNSFPVSPWQPTYVRLLRAAYPAIKKADPGATVVLSGLANYSWRALASLYKAGAKGLFDVVSLHPYTRLPSGSVRIVGFNRRVMDQNGDKAMPIWVTELTWSSALGKRVLNKYGWVTTIDGQALRLSQGYTDFIKARVALGVQRVYWYTWASVDRDSPNAFDYSGLRTLTRDGKLVDKPAAVAFRKITRRYEKR